MSKSKRTTPAEKRAAISTALADVLASDSSPIPGTDAYELWRQMREIQGLSTDPIQGRDPGDSYERLADAMHSRYVGIERSIGIDKSDKVKAIQARHAEVIAAIVRLGDAANGETVDDVNERYESKKAELARMFQGGKGEMEREQYRDTLRDLKETRDRELEDALPSPSTVDPRTLLIIPPSLPEGADKLRERAIINVFDQVAHAVHGDMNAADMEREAATFVNYVRDHQSWVIEQLERLRPKA
jgi:hypothetical protein